MQWIEKPEKLLEFMLAIAANKELEDYGTLCHPFIVNLLDVTQIFGYPTKMLSRIVIWSWSKRAVKLIILNVLTILCVNEFLV